MHNQMIERICEKAESVTVASSDHSVTVVLKLKGTDALKAKRWLERRTPKDSSQTYSKAQRGNGHEQRI